MLNRAYQKVCYAVKTFEGILSLSKNGNPRNALRTGALNLRRYLDTLRP
jgi:hypothetical protein